MDSRWLVSTRVSRVSLIVLLFVVALLARPAAASSASADLAAISKCLEDNVPLLEGIFAGSVSSATGCDGLQRFGSCIIDAAATASSSSSFATVNVLTGMAQALLKEALDVLGTCGEHSIWDIFFPNTTLSDIGPLLVAGHDVAAPTATALPCTFSHANISANNATFRLALASGHFNMYDV